MLSRCLIAWLIIRSRPCRHNFGNVRLELTMIFAEFHSRSQLRLPHPHLLIWTLSGASANTNCRRAPMQRFFQQAMEAAEEAGVAPTQEYTADNNAQYVQNSYGYPPPSSTFAIDQSLQMPESVEEYSVDNVADHGQRQENGTSPLPEQNGTDSVTNSHVNPTPTSTALPVTPAQAQTSFNPSTKRKSLDDTHEIPAVGESQSGRKRSKVSRACDQCRRKKVQLNVVCWSQH